MKQEDWSARRPIIVGIIVLVALVAGFGTWANTARISGAVIAQGQIKVDRNRQVVQHLEGGIVDKILVDEGDTVKAGQVLVRLDSTLLTSKFSTTEGQLFELMARRGRYEAERDDTETILFSNELRRAAQTQPRVSEILDGQERLFQIRKKTMRNEVVRLGKRQGQLSAQIAGIKAQQHSLETQIALIREELDDQKALFQKGLTSTARLLSLQREEAELSGQAGALAAQKAQAEGRITELEIESVKLAMQRQEEAITKLRDIQFNEIELREDRRSLKERLSRMDLLAPASGVIYGLQVFSPRSVLRAAQPVLYVVPQDRPLVIAAQIETLHIDQIFVGQDVALRFSALDRKDTSELSGQVITVSPDAFHDKNTNTRFYLAEVTLTQSEIAKLPKGTKLIPGMPVEVFLRTHDQTPMAYLVKPFADFFAKAFRES